MNGEQNIFVTLLSFRYRPSFLQVAGRGLGCGVADPLDWGKSETWIELLRVGFGSYRLCSLPLRVSGGSWCRTARWFQDGSTWSTRSPCRTTKTRVTIAVALWGQMDGQQSRSQERPVPCCGSQTRTCQWNWDRSGSGTGPLQQRRTRGPHKGSQISTARISARQETARHEPESLPST